MEAHASEGTASPGALEGFTGEMVDELALAWEELSAYEEEATAQREPFAASEQRYRELFDLAPGAYLVTGIFGGIQEANRAAGTLLNMYVAQLMGKPLVIFIAAADRQAFVTRLIQLQAPNSPAAAAATNASVKNTINTVRIRVSLANSSP